MTKPIWGIDLGGTKIEAVVMEKLDPTTVISRQRIATEQQHGYRHILNQIARLVDQVATEVGTRPKTIGIATPGALDPTTQTLKNSNTTCLNGQLFKKDLEEILDFPIRMANDANCFALAEAVMGVVPAQVPDAKVVFGIIMGTGVGGGVVIDGKVLDGRHSIGGEWRHNFLDASGGACYCGKIGCVETVISGTALQKYYMQISGEKRKLPEIVVRSREGGDFCAQATVVRLVEMFGQAVSAIINVLDPDAIVLGGGLGHIDELYSEGKKAAERHLFNPRLETPFLKPMLGDSAGVFGAAALVAP